VTSEASSYRRILWATSLIGRATLLAALIGLVRNKAVALIGGPAAVGLLGIFTSLVTMGSSIATLGLDTSAVRQIAQPDLSEAETARTQRAIWTMAWPLALIGGVAVWLFRDPLAQFAVGDAAYSNTVGWLGIGVAATVIGASQLAILQGHGRLGDLARVRLWGSFLATLIGVAAVYHFGIAGILIAVLAMPLVIAITAFWLGRDLPRSNWKRLTQEKLSDHWRVLTSIGVLVMMTNIVVSLNELSIRAVVTHRLGLDFAGLYVASHAIISVNLSLLLNAIAADYYPRVSKVADDPKAMTLILNQQLQVALLLAGPLLAAVSLAAPLALTVLYSSAFADSALLLRLLIIGGVLRLGIWPLGFILLSRRAGGAYLSAEIVAASAIPIAWLLVPLIGLTGLGVAIIASALISFLAYYWQVRRGHGVYINRGNFALLGLLMVFLCALAVTFEFSTMSGIALGILGTAALCWRSYRLLRAAVAE